MSTERPDCNKQVRKKVNGGATKSKEAAIFQVELFVMPRGAIVHVW